MLAERIANFRQAPPQPREARYVTDNSSSGYMIDMKVVHAVKPEATCKGLMASATEHMTTLQQHDCAPDGAGPPLWTGSRPSFGGRTDLQQPSLQQDHCLLHRRPQGHCRQCTSMSTPEGRAAQTSATPPCQQMVQVCATCSVCIWESQHNADTVMKVLQHQLQSHSGCRLLTGARS